MREGIRTKDDADVEDEFYCAVGKFTVAWAHLEMMLDVFVMVTHGHGGDAISRKLPKHLQPKLDYLRRAFNELPMFADACGTTFSLIDGIERLSRVRHDLIHGVVFQGVSSGNSMARFLRFACSKDMHVRETSAAEIATHEGDVRAFTGCLTITASTMTARLAADVNARLGGNIAAEIQGQP